MTKRLIRCGLGVALACLAGAPAHAQDLFEIQVYPYETVQPGQTMLEFHTNFIPSGCRASSSTRAALTAWRTP